jgi:hypothetical protein
MIKPILPAAALIGASLLLPTVARANNYSGINHYCFLVDGAGEVINLSQMCVNRNPAPAAESRAALSGAALEEALTTGTVIHADAFCEARAQGGTRREANNAATSALASYMVSEGISADDLTPAFFSRAEESSKLLCPELQPTGRYN